MQERVAWERLVGQSPFRPRDKDKQTPVLFRDRWDSFSSLFLQGLDFDFLMMYVCVLSFIEMTARKNFNVKSQLILGVLITYILDCLLVYMRQYFGKRNIAKQTLTDEGFLF